MLQAVHSTNKSTPLFPFSRQKERKHPFRAAERYEPLLRLPQLLHFTARRTQRLAERTSRQGLRQADNNSQHLQETRRQTGNIILETTPQRRVWKKLLTLC